MLAAPMQCLLSLIECELLGLQPLSIDRPETVQLNTSLAHVGMHLQQCRVKFG